MSLKITLMLAKEKGITHFHRYGDSQLVINWITRKNTLHNYILWPLFNEIKSLSRSFSQVNYSHVYMQ
jgi:ribonuclease HI